MNPKQLRNTLVPTILAFVLLAVTMYAVDKIFQVWFGWIRGPDWLGSILPVLLFVGLFEFSAILNPKLDIKILRVTNGLKSFCLMTIFYILVGLVALFLMHEEYRSWWHIWMLASCILAYMLFVAGIGQALKAVFDIEQE